MYAPLVALLLLAAAAGAAELFIVSATTYNTCNEVPGVSKQPVLTPAGADASDNTVCGVLGSGTNVTALRVRIQQDRKPFTGFLSLSITSVPPTGGTVTDGDDRADSALDCDATTPAGGDCAVLENPVLVTFESTPLRASYDLFRRPRQYYYGVKATFTTNFEDCCGGSNQRSSCCDKSDIDWRDAISNDVFGYGKGVGCYDLSKNTNKDVSFGVLSSTQGVDGLNACPSLDSLVLGNNVKSSSNFTSLYIGPSTTIGGCSSMACKIPRSISGENGERWNLLGEYYLYPQCSLFDMNPSPRAEILVRATLIQTSRNNRTAFVDFYSGDNNAYKASSTPGVPIVGKFIDLKSATNVIQYTRPDAILVCREDGFQDPSRGSAQTSNFCADMPPRGTSPQQQLYNPWTETNLDASLLSRNIREHCTVPLGACRKLFLNNDDNSSLSYSYTSYAQWAYIIESRLPFWAGSGCNQNPNSPNSLSSQSVIAKQCNAMIQSTTTNSKTSLAGECIPGYEQITAPTAFTPCQIEGVHAKYAARLSSSRDRSKSQFIEDTDPLLDFVPLDYNPLAPNMWLMPGKFYMEALPAASGTDTAELLLLFPGTFLGTVATVPSGEFVHAGMVCGAVQAGPGSITYSARGRGQLGGTVQVQIAWTGNGQALIENPSCTFSRINGGAEMCTQSVDLRVNRAVTTTTFNFEFSGDLWLDLVFTLTMYSKNPKSAAYTKTDEIKVTCTVTRGAVIADFQHVFDELSGRDLPHPGCSWYNPRTVYCWDHFYHNFWGRVWNIGILWPAIVLTSALILEFIIWASLRMCKGRAAHEKAVKKEEFMKAVINNNKAAD